MPNQAVSPQERLEIQVQQLQQQVASLTQMLGAPPAVAPRYPMWGLIRDYLRTAGGSATPISITEGLMKAGHNLGRYPLRNVKITLTSPMMRGVFRIKTDATGQETVVLIDRTVPFTVRKWIDKKPARKPKR